MKKQVKLYLSHDADKMLEDENRRTTLAKSTIVELLIRQHLTNGGVVPVKEVQPVAKDQPAKAAQEQETDNGEDKQGEASLDDEGESSLNDAAKGYIPYY